MKSGFCAGAALLMCGVWGASAADGIAVNVPVALDYALIEQALREHLFSGDGASLTVSQDAAGCNRVTAAAPRVAASGDGRVAV
ncbi:MAG: hypothetical protein WD928_18715, partial [Gammaproteobacteria bacterium]